MKPLPTPASAKHHRLGMHSHKAPLQAAASFVLLLCTIAWSYEMLTFVPTLQHAAPMPLAMSLQPDDSATSDATPEPDPSANAIASFDIAPS